MAAPVIPVLDEALVRKIAHLARLELTDAEVRNFVPQLAEIVGYVRGLESVSVQGVEPLRHPFGDQAVQRLRADEVREDSITASLREKVLACAPDTVDGGFKVPPIL